MATIQERITAARQALSAATDDFQKALLAIVNEIQADDDVKTGAVASMQARIATLTAQRDALLKVQSAIDAYNTSKTVP